MMGKDVTWSEYFIHVADQIAIRSKCLSRQIGAVIVRNKSILSTGYNGPPKGYYHCGVESGLNKCPRQVKGYRSGQGLSECPAAHAEVNAIAQAACNGVSVRGATLYLNTVSPCKNCMATIINSGIARVICKDRGYYDELGPHMAKVCGIKLLHYKEVDE